MTKMLGLLMMAITLVWSGVNGQSSTLIGLCLINGVNDISRVDPFCGSQLRTFINTRNFFNLSRPTLDEVCSASCWDRFSPVIRRCFSSDADSAGLGYRLVCGRQPDGDNCAQVFNSLRDDMSNNAVVCMVTTPGRCPAGCTNYLMDWTRRLGCCFGESIYLFSMFASTRQLYVNAMEAYRTCNLPFPQPCQNVSIEATSSAAAGGWAINGVVMIVMLMVSLMV